MRTAVRDLEVRVRVDAGLHDLQEPVLRRHVERGDAAVWGQRPAVVRQQVDVRAVLDEQAHLRGFAVTVGRLKRVERFSNVWKSVSVTVL